MNVKRYLPLLIALTLVALGWCIYRDIQLEKKYTSDLRNRVVGARLQKDGKLPYFYKWKQNDGLRYYDPANFDTLKVANITATPFFHTLMYPLVEFPQRTISRIWLAIEYILMFACILLALPFTSNNRQKAAVVLTTILLLFTEAWAVHTINGQLYICIPFIAMLFYYSMQQKNRLSAAFLAGICAITLVLVRPNTLVFFIPFLFMAKKYSRRFIFVFILPILLIGGWNIFNKQEYSFWKNYREALVEGIQLHQDLHPTIIYNTPDPGFEKWEGWSKKELDSSDRFTITYSEHGNVFVLFQHIFHKKTSINSIKIFAILSLIGLSILFLIIYKKKRTVSVPNIAIFGFCLYMVTDFFSPIWRHQYNTVQWLFPLLIAAAYYKISDKWIYLLLLTGLLLNIVNTDLIKMEHTIGEYIFMITFLILSFTRNLQPAK